jgi:hypothetical protein
LRTKQAPADSFLDKSKGVFSFTRFRFGQLRPELHRSQPIFSIFKARLRPF